MEAPLDGITVLDISQSAAAPSATQALAELGAEVLSVEPPGGGAQRRLIGGTFFPNLCRDKLSIAVDLKSEDGDRILRRLIEEVDVFVHNYRNETIERLGYDYETVRSYNEGIVYCSVTGFGEDGPYSDRPALDPLAQAMSGLMDVTGEPDRKPSRVGSSVIDVSTGFVAALGIVVGLFARERTGEGRHVEASLVDTAAAFMGYWYTHYSKTGESPVRSGHTYDGYAPVGVFETADDPVYLSVPYQPIWRRFCEAIDRAGWIDDPRFETDDDRLEHRDALYAAIEEAFGQYTREELMSILLANDVPVSEVNSVPEAHRDEHLRRRGTVTEIDDTDGEEVTVSTTPLRVHGTERSPGPLPEVGEHTEAVLRSLDFSDDEIAVFHERGTIESPDAPFEK
jgi:crotonobetainyl-CoA:carnitine CoA-transferase CaiB-like acyl-CoA transferase